MLSRAKENVVYSGSFSVVQAKHCALLSARELLNKASLTVDGRVWVSLKNVGKTSRKVVVEIHVRLCHSAEESERFNNFKIQNPCRKLSLSPGDVVDVDSGCVVTVTAVLAARKEC